MHAAGEEPGPVVVPPDSVGTQGSSSHSEEQGFWAIWLETAEGAGEHQPHAAGPCGGPPSFSMVPAEAETWWCGQVQPFCCPQVWVTHSHHLPCTEYLAPSQSCLKTFS